MACLVAAALLPLAINAMATINYNYQTRLPFHHNSCEGVSLLPWPFALSLLPLLLHSTDTGPVCLPFHLSACVSAPQVASPCLWKNEIKFS